MGAWSARLTTGRKRSVHRGMVVHAGDLAANSAHAIRPWKTACGLRMEDPEQVDAGVNCDKCRRVLDEADRKRGW